MSDLKEYVEVLAKKASEVADSTEAMKFSQAALNAAQAMSILSIVKEGGRG